MIKYYKKERLFILTNYSITLGIYVNCNKQLETVYFGKYSKEIDFFKTRIAAKDNWSTSYYDIKKNEEKTYEDNTSNRLSRYEIGTHALSDNRPAPIIIQKTDGNYETALEYVDYTIYKGYPSYKTGPHAHDGNIETLEIRLVDEFDSNIEVKYNISIDLDKDVIVKNFEFINKGKEPVKLLRAMSMQLDLPTNEYDVHHFGGKWARERDEFINPIIDGEQNISSNYGRSSHEENPFVFLRKKESSLHDGEVIGFNLIYSGNFKFTIFSDYLKSARIIYGLNDYNFCWLLEKNQSFVTPQAVIAYSCNGINKMSQIMHSFVKENIVTYKDEKKYKSIIFNSWEGCEMNFTTESVISYIDDSLKIGSELFVLDDGWFSNRNTDWSGLGDWWVNKDKIDLHKVVDYCHKKGLKFGLWFEPEMVNYDSELFKKHPDYAIGYTRERISCHRHQFLLDFTNKEVVDNIYQQMVKIIKEYKMDYIKWDHNRDLKECFIPHLGKDRQGEVTHRIVLGYYDLIERLTKEFPNILFEGCASGGGRFDLGTLYYCPQIWCSDNSSPDARMFIQYNTSFGYPLSTMGSHVNASKVTDYRTKAYLSLFGTYGYEMNPNKLNDSEKEELLYVAKIYKEYHSKLFENGDLYHLSSPHTSNLMMMEVVSKDKTCASLIMMNTRFEHTTYRYIVFKGLDENKKYHIYNNSFDDVMFGSELMGQGLNTTFVKPGLNDYDCLFLMLDEVK